MAEKLAGVAFLGRHALLVGNGIFGGADQILTGANDADNGENTDGNGKIAAIFAWVAQCSLNGAADVRRNVTATAATAALGGRFENLCAEHDGVNDLDNGDGRVGHTAAELRRAAKIVVRRALEDADIALTAEEDDLLFQNGDSLEFLNAVACDACFKAKLDIELDVDGIKATVEWDGCDVDLCPCDAGAFDADVGGVFDDVVAEIGQKHADVLKTIPIAAGVQNAIGLNADHISAGRGIAGKFVFCHNGKPPYGIEPLCTTFFCNSLCAAGKSVRDKSGNLAKKAEWGFSLDQNRKLCYNNRRFFSEGGDDMEIRREEIAHVAKLSKLALSETELEQMQQALVEILENMKTLEELELSDMSASAEAVLVNVFREDVIQPSAPRDVLLQNAPARNADSMIVPKTVE